MNEGVIGIGDVFATGLLIGLIIGLVFGLMIGLCIDGERSVK